MLAFLHSATHSLTCLLAIHTNLLLSHDMGQELCTATCGSHFSPTVVVLHGVNVPIPTYLLINTQPLTGGGGGGGGVRERVTS